MVLAELIEDVPLEVVDHAITYFRYLTGAFQSSQARSRVRLIQFGRRGNGESKNIAETKSGSREEE